MEHLAKAGLTCPTPVRDAQGRMLRTLAGRPAALVTFLEGVWIRRPQPRHCAAVGPGAWRACIWRARASRCSRANALGTRRLAAALCQRFQPRADEIAPGLAATIEQELDHLEANWPADLPQGVIHADLFPDNVFFLGDQLSGLIDFYFACNDALAYDIAIALNAWCFESDHAFNMTKGQALLKGYQSARALEPAEREALPLLARGAALRFLLTRAYDWLHTANGCARQPQGPARIPAPAQVPPQHPLGQRVRPGGPRLMTAAKPAVVIYTDGACSRQSRARRLGRDPDLRQAPQGDLRRRGADAPTTAWS